MSGTFSVGGLISGLDSNSIISQLVSIESQPITRMRQHISDLQAQQTAIRSLRTQLLSLRNSIQDFRLGDILNQYAAVSSADTVMTATVSGQNPVIGSYAIDIQQLATATSARSSAVLGAAISPSASLASSGMTTDVTAGTFTINGVSFTVDPSTQSLNTILGQITSSAAGVTATYDAVNDKVTIANTAAGDTSLINFGSGDDTSNFLDAIAVTGAMQADNGSGSTYATSTRNLGAANPSEDLNTVHFAGGTVSAGTISINGVSITIDPATDSISDIIARINESDAQVKASYDTTSDTLRFVSETMGSRTIRFTAGTSNFMNVMHLDTAIQTAGNDAKFTINGGAVQTRNTNEVSDAIGGITLKFLDLGKSTVTVSGDDDKIVEDVQAMVDAFNESVDALRGATAQSGQLSGDASISSVELFLRQAIFNVVSGLTGDYRSFVDIGISTGDTFDAESSAHLTLDGDKFREALSSDRSSVARLFTNDSKNGIADQLFTYLDDITKTTGFLNDRSKSNGTIDQQISDVNDQIARKQDQVAAYETRLKKQFSQLEQLSSAFQSQSSALSVLGRGLSSV